MDFIIFYDITDLGPLEVVYKIMYTFKFCNNRDC